MKCPGCGSTTEWTHTCTRENGDVVERYSKCKKCGHIVDRKGEEE